MTHIFTLIHVNGRHITLLYTSPVVIKILSNEICIMSDFMRMYQSLCKSKNKFFFIFVD
jgi:hypothetical protein